MKLMQFLRKVGRSFCLVAALFPSVAYPAQESIWSKALPPTIQPVPAHDTSRSKTYFVNSRQVQIWSGDELEFVQEQLRFRELGRTLLDGADSQQLGFLVERCPPQRAAPQLRSDERPAIIHAIVKIGEPFFVTDNDAQSRYEQLLTSPDRSPAGPKIYSSVPYELVGEMSALDDHVLEIEKEGEIGVLMNVFHQVFEPSFRRSKRHEMSALRFTLRVRSGKTKFFVPGVESRVTAVICRWTGTTRVGLIVGNSGGSISGTATYADGTDSASDALVSRATLVVLSKLLGLPVHRVISGLPNPDPEILRAERVFFGRMTAKDQILSLQYLLQKNGFECPKSGALDSATTFALRGFESRHGIQDGLAGVYLKLLEITPVAGATPSTPELPSGGVTLSFEGFPDGDAPLLRAMLVDFVGARRLHPTGNRFNFTVDYEGDPETLAAGLPAGFFHRTHRNLTTSILSGRRILVRHLSGFGQ